MVHKMPADFIKGLQVLRCNCKCMLEIAEQAYAEHVHRDTQYTPMKQRCLDAIGCYCEEGCNLCSQDANCAWQNAQLLPSAISLSQLCLQSRCQDQWFQGSSAAAHACMQSCKLMPCERVAEPLHALLDRYSHGCTLAAHDAPTP